ncbi:MAG: manganese efflux pump [Candidatus Electrothrix sp. AR3]|nr:manganese efflux pump [Candidatus Electrothrix sp. AR3]
MDFFAIIIISCGLAMDSAAVSLVAAASGFVHDTRSSSRLVFHLGLFQGLMPVLGWLAGINFVASFSAIDHWIAFALLAFVGGRMLLSGLNQNLEEIAKDPSRGLTLVLLSLATSIDALAVGLSLSMLEVSIWYPAVIIGGITALLSTIAIMIGKKVGMQAGKRMEIFGGLILIAIGIRILVTHLS